MSASEALSAARLFVIWLEGHKIHKSAQTVRALIEENEQLHAALRAIANEPRSVAPVDTAALTEAIRASVLADRELSAQAVRMRGVAGVRSGLFGCGLTPAKEVR